MLKLDPLERPTFAQIAKIFEPLKIEKPIEVIP